MSRGLYRRAAREFASRLHAAGPRLYLQRPDGARHVAFLIEIEDFCRGARASLRPAADGRPIKAGGGLFSEQSAFFGFIC